MSKVTGLYVWPYTVWNYSYVLVAALCSLHCENNPTCSQRFQQKHVIIQIPIICKWGNKTFSWAKIIYTYSVSYSFLPLTFFFTPLLHVTVVCFTLNSQWVLYAAKVCVCALQQWESVTHSCTRSQQSAMLAHRSDRVLRIEEDVHLSILESVLHLRDCARAECHLQSNSPSSSATLIRWTW